MKMKRKMEALFDLFLLTSGWADEFDKPQRFVIGGLLSFFAYYIFKHLDKFGVEGIDWLAANVTELGPGALSIAVLGFSGFAFYISIVAATVIASLIPQDSKHVRNEG